MPPAIIGVIVRNHRRHCPQSSASLSAIIGVMPPAYVLYYQNHV